MALVRYCHGSGEAVRVAGRASMGTGRHSTTRGPKPRGYQWSSVWDSKKKTENHTSPFSEEAKKKYIDTIEKLSALGWDGKCMGQESAGVSPS